jgi:hypothetical protein
MGKKIISRYILFKLPIFGPAERPKENPMGWDWANRTGYITSAKRKK